MYYRANNTVVGVLNDYDLASLKGDPPLGNERTGTIPFMALELLSPNGQNGKVKHLYRHDLESFIWVLVWLSLQYKDGEKVKRGPIEDWAKMNADKCYSAKWHFLRNPQFLPVRVLKMVNFLCGIELKREMVSLDFRIKLEQGLSKETSGVPGVQPSPQGNQKIEDASARNLWRNFSSFL